MELVYAEKASVEEWNQKKIKGKFTVEISKGREFHMLNWLKVRGKWYLKNLVDK